MGHRHRRHRRHNRHMRHNKNRRYKKIFFWILIILVGYLILSFLFSPIQFQKIKNTFSQAEGRISSREAVDMNHNCDFSSVEFFGYDPKDIIKLDCTDACNERDLTYVSYGCPKDKFTCYCN